MASASIRNGPWAVSLTSLTSHPGQKQGSATCCASSCCNLQSVRQLQLMPLCTHHVHLQRPCRPKCGEALSMFRSNGLISRDKATDRPHGVQIDLEIQMHRSSQSASTSCNMLLPGLRASVHCGHQGRGEMWLKIDAEKPYFTLARQVQLPACASVLITGLIKSALHCG